ncbi:hypothetical protein [Flavobacterium sp. UMI-01]|uniref:hypothetical protein n=1 Tax=Flavobacterium sp. UMI-01 TaxID=1441053 RepID=UPI001C7D6529|nr:hypothetical protein [Flavobacterium sp. UMI-01]GIZ07628.1 hypothetical protein FUMI01_03550 [Flavobacterium sp. UMI-01]
MKNLFILLLITFSLSAFSQQDCNYNTNVKDSLGVYKLTNEYLISEKNFAGKSEYIFCSLASDNGFPALNVQLIQKSKEFISAKCFDKNSKLHLQLQNGKIITLLHINKESCGTLIRNNEGYDNRINTGTFMFIKGTMEELKSSPVTLLRIKFLTSTDDYVVKKEITSEMNQKVYFPETYFMNYLKCIE